MTPEMVTVWDGSHHNIGADLLCVPAEIRRQPEPIRTSLTGGAAKVLDLLRQRPMTAEALCHAAGWTQMQTARHAIYQYRNAGHRAPYKLLSRRNSTTGHELLYWLAGVDYEGLETAQDGCCDQNGSETDHAHVEAAR